MSGGIAFFHHLLVVRKKLHGNTWIVVIALGFDHSESAFGVNIKEIIILF